MKLELRLEQSCVACDGDLSKGNHSDCFRKLAAEKFRESNQAEPLSLRQELTREAIELMREAIALDKVEGLRELLVEAGDIGESIYEEIPF